MERAASLMWQARIVCLPDMKSPDRKQVLNQIQEAGKPLGRRESLDYSQYDTQTRMQLIGSCLMADSKWLENHQSELQWLSEQGIRPVECVNLFKRRVVNREWKLGRTIKAGAKLQ